MNRHVRNGLLVAAAAGVCAAAVWGGLWYRARPEKPGALLERIPTSDALVVYLDFAALRHDGLLRVLESSKIAEEPEYRDFARRIEFDYRQDLDSALLAVAPTGNFLLAQGRFHWDRLRAYAQSQNGRCAGSLCRMPGSTPERRISFFPVRSNLMALAVSTDESAALRLANAGSGPEPAVPEAPLWVFIPSSVLQSGESLPEEARRFAHSLSRADSVILALVPESSRFAAKLTVRCHDDQDAANLASQLTGTTTALRQILSSQKHLPSPTDFTGVLTSGSFRSEGARVYGYWPLERALLENLLGAAN